MSPGHDSPPRSSAAVISEIASEVPAHDQSKSERIANEFERRILSGEFAPGERLPTEAELCVLLGVSRSVVRDAIRSLAGRGLVAVRQGLGMTVAIPNDAAFGRALIALLSRSDLTMGDVMNARATLETGLVPLAAGTVTDQDLDELRNSFEAMAAAVRSANWDRARETHLQFHVGLLRALHQPALELFLKPMTEIILISSAPPRRTAEEDWEVETHLPILDALAARDARTLEDAVANHFRATTDPRRYRAFRARPFRAVFSEVPWAHP